MTRLLLALTVIIALGVLLWGSWQWGKKPFISVLCLALLVLLGALGVGIWHSEQDNLIAMAPEGVELQINSSNPSGRSLRLVGEANNQGAHALSRMMIEARAWQCPQQDQCQQVHQQRLPLDMYLPIGARYPFSVLVESPPREVQVDYWDVEIIEVLAYPRDPQR